MEATGKQLKWGALIFFSLYIIGAWLFKPNGTETSEGGIMGSIVVLCLVVFCCYIAFAVWWRMHETGTKVFTNADGQPRFTVPAGIKDVFRAKEQPTVKPDDTQEKRFSNRSLWVCIVVGAVGFHWYHTIYPLFTCMIIRSFFLPTTMFSVVARWAYIFMMIVFYYLPGIETYSVAKGDNLKAMAEQLGKEAKNHKTPTITEAVAPQAQSTGPKKIALTKEWSEAVYPPLSGGTITFSCTSTAAQVKIVYKSAESPLFASGEPFDCVPKERQRLLAKMFTGAVYYFRSDDGGLALIEGGM